MARLLVLAAACLLVACSASAEDSGKQPDGRVRDFAEIIDPNTEALLAERLDRAEALYGPQVGVVTVKSLDGYPIEDFTTRYANEWGLGDKERDDGLIILIAPNERKVRIGTGHGIEDTYTDAWAAGVIEQTLLPQFRQANYGRGLEGAVDMIIERMRQFPTRPANDDDADNKKEAA